MPSANFRSPPFPSTPPVSFSRETPPPRLRCLPLARIREALFPLHSTFTIVNEKLTKSLGVASLRLATRETFFVFDDAFFCVSSRGGLSLSSSLSPLSVYRYGCTFTFFALSFFRAPVLPYLSIYLPGMRLDLSLYNTLFLCTNSLVR